MAATWLKQHFSFSHSVKGRCPKSCGVEFHFSEGVVYIPGSSPLRSEVLWSAASVSSITLLWCCEETLVDSNHFLMENGFCFRVWVVLSIKFKLHIHVNRISQGVKWCTMKTHFPSNLFPQSSSRQKPVSFCLLSHFRESLHYRKANIFCQVDTVTNTFSKEQYH